MKRVLWAVAITSKCDYHWMQGREGYYEDHVQVVVYILPLPFLGASCWHLLLVLFLRVSRVDYDSDDGLDSDHESAWVRLARVRLLT